MKKIAVVHAAAALTIAASATLVGVTAQPAAAQPRECANSDLTASYHARGAGAGHRFGVIKLTNTTPDQVCFVQGYGGLSYVGHGNGTQIGAAATRDPGRRPVTVLDPGKSVVSRVDESVAQNYPRGTCRPVPVDGFRVYVPDARVSQYVVHPTTGCANPAVHLIGHQPYRRPA
ncbi:DUF4232 domain-containing protein [Nocardioides sp. C4-1]|uniref:DUF4232 domain-containing protein n=1 Tax=Nocardioides sp. C4-1 TaxID=3151851 RepID=UPI00326763F5